MQTPSPARSPRLLTTALALSLGAAISLGLARFAYALLLPAMRADLGWSYFTAGAMNTANAAGYLAGALLMPRALARVDAHALLLGGAGATSLLLAAHGGVRADAALYALRALAGVASAAVFVSGGLLAARLGQVPGARPALVLGLYYGGAGAGIVVSAALVPGWRWPVAWELLAGASLLATLLLAWGTRALAKPGAVASPQAASATSAPSATSASSHPPADRPAPSPATFRARDFAWGLLAYLMFGLGYIGYMTFIVTLLRGQGLGDGAVTAFYALLGFGTLASPWLWAGLLQRQRGGGALAVLNALLAAATLGAVMATHPVAVFASGALFGAVFLSVVASTTALVRHNLPTTAWPAGISAFTIVFAAGQIVGPSVVGWVADGPGGLRRGLALSAGALLLGAVLATRQKPLGGG